MAENGRGEIERQGKRSEEKLCEEGGQIKVRGESVMEGRGRNEKG